jgi:UDP-N-acetyl-D-glucosamine dehydrogenase
MVNSLQNRIETRAARIGVVGLGYVGLPLLIEFAKAGFPVLGLDVDANKTDALKSGESYIRHIPKEDIADIFDRGTDISDATTDFKRVSECDALLICVPTPLTSHREPDLRFVEQTANTIAPHLRRGQLIVLESTTFPGTTEDILVPILEKGSGLVAGKDFNVAYSPEREDPNNRQYHTTTIPKVVGGVTPECLSIACALYESVICKTVPVSNCRTAEATKLMENIFRSVNIALANELKTVFTPMDIDIWEATRAASTKPFGYMPFYPGPGLGGHCIPIDPFYLTWKAREYGITTRFIELAGEINTGMPVYVINQLGLAMNEREKPINGSRILLVGLAYKKNVDDDRESPTYALWRELRKRGAMIDYYDSYCPVIRPSREHGDLTGMKSVSWTDVPQGGYDAAIVVTAHDNVDHDKLAEWVGVVLDTRGVCQPAENVVRA